nr:choice-of-anchor I family protein [Bryobacterales bacterium]
AEIPAYDPTTKRIFVTNSFAMRVDVTDISDPENPIQRTPIDLGGRNPNSVAVSNGMVAVAVEAAVKQNGGKVLVFDADGKETAQYDVGALPDMLTFTPNGKYLLVANEGEPDTTYTVDPEGSVSVIEVATGVVRTARFDGFRKEDLDPTVRIFGPNARVAQDLEPEYIAVASDSKTAWVSLQEANAFAVLDIESATITAVVPAQLKDHSLPGNGLDASDRDNAINIRNWPIFGMRQPDAMAAFEYEGETYYITANEGDARDYDGFAEESRLRSLTLDPEAFPDRNLLRDNANLGRLTVTTANGDTDGDGDFDEIWAFGGRSISIYKADGTLVWDSGDEFERITAQRYPESFNASNDNNDFDNRSDNKGPEPEGITVATLAGRNYAFVTLERIGGVMAYDITNPMAPFFVTYVNDRDLSQDPETPQARDLGPEAALVISAEDSPNGKPLLVVTNEVSGTTGIFQLAPAMEVTDQVIVSTRRLPVTRRDEDTRVYLSLTNRGAQAIDGPLHVVFRNLPEGVELLNPSFTNGEGVGFTVPAPSGRLAGNATIVAPTPRFLIPRGTVFSYDVRVYAGDIQ